MLERYNPKTCTFFTLVGEMGFALHETHEVFWLLMWDIPYEEYIPTMKELPLMKKDALLAYETSGKCCATFISAPRLLG